MNTITITPQLTAAEKKILHNWLLKALVVDDYCFNTDTVYNVFPKLMLWGDDTPKTIHSNSYWATTENKIYIGYAERRVFPTRDCLLILLALTQFVDRTPELEKVVTKALIKYLSGEASVLHKAALIEAPVPMEGVAFSDDKVAMLLAGEWMTAAGETVDVTGWSVYANQLPVAAETQTEVEF